MFDCFPFLKHALSLYLTLSSAMLASAQSQSSSKDAAAEIAAEQKLPPFKPSPYFFTTPEYKEAALRGLVEEANNVARDLHLTETLPIRASNLLEISIATPASGRLGLISTSNYVYYIGLDGKFAGIDQRNLDACWADEKRAYDWPLDRLDTNSAFLYACSTLKAVGVDVVALNRECDLDIRARNLSGTRFVPDYWLSWSKKRAPVVFLSIFMPTTTIRILKIEDPKYVWRPGVIIPNIGEILRRGNAPKVLLRKMGLDTNSTSIKN